MFLTVVLSISGGVLIYIYSGGIVTGPGETHAWLGFITSTLAFLQPIGALFRPHPDSSRRPIFNWLHWLMGNTAHVLASERIVEQSSRKIAMISILTSLFSFQSLPSFSQSI